MGEAFIELMFWIVVFVVFFFGFRHLQNRKKKRHAEAETRSSEATRQPDKR